MYKVKPNVGMMFKFQFHYENGERVDLQKATNAIVEIRTVDSSSNITSSFADDFGYDLTNNCMWVRFSADAVVTVGNVVSANLTVQIRNTTGAYEYITTAAFVNLFVISNDDDAASVNGVIIDKPVKLSAAGLSITAHSPYINADGYWVYYSDDNNTWIVSTYKATNDVIVDKDSITHLKDGVGNGSLVSTNDDKSSAGNTAAGLNCISLGSSNSNAGTSDVVLLGNGNRAKSSAINAVGVAGADVDASVAFAVGQGRIGNSRDPKNVFAISPYGDISYRPNTDTDRLTNLQSTLNLGFINNLSYNKTSKKISYYVYTPNENFPSEHKQYTIDLSTLVSGDKTVTDTTYNSTTNAITVTYNDGTTSTFTLNEGGKISTYVKSFVRTFQAASPVCFDAVTDQDGTTKTLFSPALFMKEPQTSLVLDNVYTGNSGGQTEYFKWFYDQYQITESTSSAINTFFNLPIDFATKPDCTPFVSSHVIVPTLSCMNGALALYQKKLTAGTNITITDAGVISAAGGSSSYLFYNGAGKYNKQSGSEVELVGHRTTGNGIILGDYNPNASVPQLASGENSMAFGYANQATASYAVGIGNTNTVSATYSFGVGYLNTVSAANSYAIGQNNNVGTSASYSMIVGYKNTANNQYSMIFGNECVSNGNNSTLVGYGLKSDANYQFVIGQYNDNSNEHIFEIGFGQSDSQRSNLLYVDYDGDLHCKGDIYYKKSVLTTDVSNGVLSISSLARFINISTSNGTITSINDTSTAYSAGDEITLYGTFTYNVDGSSLKVTDGALKIIYTGTKFVRLY